MVNQQPTTTFPGVQSYHNSLARIGHALDLFNSCFYYLKFFLFSYSFDYVSHTAQERPGGNWQSRLLQLQLLLGHLNI